MLTPFLIISFSVSKHDINHNYQYFVDINECAMYQDTCSEGQTCENSIGSFQCRRSMSCGTGYTVDQDSQLCLGNIQT